MIVVQLHTEFSMELYWCGIRNACQLHHEYI